ncbi:MAG: hypothetical protein WBA74_01215 [Cyclobacteriaceae bacterium]
MKILNIKRTRQLFAFNQTVTLFLDGEICGKLTNGDKLALKIKNETSKLVAKSCFGSEEVVLDSSESTPSDITVQFGTTDLIFLVFIALFIALATAILGLLWHADMNFSAFIFIVSSFFIIRNRKQLRIIKK